MIDFKTKAFLFLLAIFLFFLIAFSMIKVCQIAKLLTWGPGTPRHGVRIHVNFHPGALYLVFESVSRAAVCFLGLTTTEQVLNRCLNSKLNWAPPLWKGRKKKMWLSALPAQAWTVAWWQTVSVWVLVSCFGCTILPDDFVFLLEKLFPEFLKGRNKI